MAESRFLKRLPTLLTEVASIIFAVLFALAVDQWWDGRENVRMAHRATAAIAQEIRENRQELLGDDDGPEPASMLAALDSAVASYRAGEKPRGFGVNWDVALLSASAWETAQMTRATQYMEMDRLISLAKLYELQRVFSRNQDELVSLIAGFRGRLEDEPVAALLDFRSRLAVMIGLRSTLSTIYACTLVQLEGPDAVEEGACPQTEADRTPGETP